MNKALLVEETHYLDMKKAVSLSLVSASRKLRLYFQANTIKVQTNFPLKQVLQKPDALGRLLKWVVDLDKFDIVFKSRTVIKGQALVDFLKEFTPIPKMKEGMEAIEPLT